MGNITIYMPVACREYNNCPPNTINQKYTEIDHAQLQIDIAHDVYYKLAVQVQGWTFIYYGILYNK